MTSSRRIAPILILLAVCSPVSADLTIQSLPDGLVVQRDGSPILTQVAKANFRPYLHPIVAPDGQGELTQFSPGHHKHQTGLYWGFTKLMVDGQRRDHFHNPGNNFFKRKEVRVIQAEGNPVQWGVVYDLLDAEGRPVMEETMLWSLRDHGAAYTLDLVWSGTGKVDLTIGEYAYGGLFLRMPWTRGINGHALNSAGQKNRDAEGKRASWVDVAMQVKGRNDLAHIVIMDHADNPGHPTPWRVDRKLGVGPCHARLGDWHIPMGRTVKFRHRMFIYTGPSDPSLVEEAWNDFTAGAKNPAGPNQSAAGGRSKRHVRYAQGSVPFGP